MHPSSMTLHYGNLQFWRHVLIADVCHTEQGISGVAENDGPQNKHYYVLSNSAPSSATMTDLLAYLNGLRLHYFISKFSLPQRLLDPLRVQVYQIRHQVKSVSSKRGKVAPRCCEQFCAMLKYHSVTGRRQMMLEGTWERDAALQCRVGRALMVAGCNNSLSAVQYTKWLASRECWRSTALPLFRT